MGGSTDGSFLVFGFGVMHTGDVFYMLAGQVSNVSGDVVVIDSVTAEPLASGASHAGWALFDVTADGAYAAFAPTEDTWGRDFVKRNPNVTKVAKTLPPKSSLAPHVFLYTAFVLHSHKAFATSRIVVAYHQGRFSRSQSFNMGYRFQTVDVAPLP